MAQILDLGKIRFNWAGTYDPATEYEYNDLVKFGPNLYAYTSATAATGVVPTTTANWAVVTEGVNWRGTYTSNTLYYKNDLVFDGTSTYIVTQQHTSANTATTSNNSNLTILALGQEGLPNFSGNVYKLLTNNGSEATWTATPTLEKEYVGTSQGVAASDFETSAQLTDSVTVFAKSTTNFAQLAMTNPSNGANASADVIIYTADGTNNSGWIDIGITSNNFDAANFGITGPHDGYVFMSAPRAQEKDISKARVVSTTATLTTTVAHGYSVGNIVKLEGVADGGAQGLTDGLYTISAVSSTTFSFVVSGVTPFSEIDLNPFGKVYKPKGDGNLVFATDRTGLSNDIVFAAGGFDSGTSQMTIHPNDKVDITITTPSTSATTGAFVVAGGVGIGGAMYAAGKGSIDGTLYLGAGAEAFETAAELTSAHLIVDFDSDGEPFGQMAMRNQDPTASADLQIYNNVGTDAAGWLDLGITGSQFSQAEFGLTGRNEGYIFFSAPDGVGSQYGGTGNLTIATSDAGTTNAIVFGAGGFTTGRTQMAIYPDQNVHIDIATASTSPSTGALTVIGGVGIQGDVNIAGNITFGGSGTQVSTANLAVSAPLIFTGDQSISTTNDLGLINEGKYTVTNIPTATIVNKALGSNVATLTTASAHNFAVGDNVTVANLDATFNGTYSITQVPSSTTFAYAKTAANVTSARVGDVTTSITAKILTGNVATLTTSTTHSYLVGQTVVVSSVDSTFNGTYTITAVTGTTFSYAKTNANVTSAAVSPNGTAVVNTSSATAAVSSATRTRWSAVTKRNTDRNWYLVSNISTKPTTSIDYAQNTYGNGADIIYDSMVLGGLVLQGSGSQYGYPYGSLTFTGNISSPAWGTTGIRHIGAGVSTLTDTSSTGTVSAAYTNTFGSNVTIAASSAVTYTDYANAYFGSPSSGANVTITNPWSILTAGAVKVGGALSVVGTTTFTGAVTASSTLNTVGNFSVATNKFTVAAATGNTVVAGTLGVTGNTTLTGTLIGGSASDIAINTNKFTVAASSGNTQVGGTLGVTGATTLSSTLDVTGNATFAGNVTITGALKFQEITEDVIDSALSGNAATLDYNAGNVFWITGTPTANMTWNITNAPTTDGKVFTVTGFITQGATGYIPSTLNVNGSAVTIKWVSNTTPTPTSVSGRIDIFNFSLIRRSSTWTALGNITANF